MRYRYLNESSPEYCTVFRQFCSVVQAAEHVAVTLDQLDEARRATARRADWLTGRQRRRYSAKRAGYITQLQDTYDQILARMLQMGWQ